MSKVALLLSAICLLSASVFAQTTPPKSPYAAIPVDQAKAANPVKPSPESYARAQKWWKLDCAMCHNANGDGKTDMAKDMKLNLNDLTDPKTLKDRTDGELFYLINKGYGDMPPEGTRVKPEENWDLVNLVRSFSKKKDAEEKPQ